MTDPKRARRAGSRRPAFVIAAAIGLAGAGVAGVALAGPFHLTHSLELAAVGLAAFFVALAVIFALARWPVAARIGTAVAAGVLGLVLVGAMLAVGAIFTDRLEDVRSTKASTGHELVVVWRHWSVDRRPEIWLRNGSGPLRQESLVYSGPLEGPLPTDVQFSGRNRIAYSIGDRDTVTTTYDLWTLRVDRVHRTPA
ncbi:hypothetical protein [Microlunatus sp. GCM10028923]|uniref:hypothetical protein n=1 Tax=Microlunatus sp. GCM10028923 TaxID=3273400 RepID=UPI00361A7081